MSQLIVNLNFWESKQLEYWLTDNYPECTIRSLYDSFKEPEELDAYAIEGNLEDDLVCYLKLRYGDQVKGGVRFANIKSK
jgi:hypothetical protein